MKINVNNLTELCKIDGGLFTVSTIDEAFNFCEKIAKGHYENFPVSSILIPKKIRKHFYSVYAFSRIADDIGDELSLICSKEECSLALDNYEKCLTSVCLNKVQTTNPIFKALENTITQFNIPISPFKKLITAFKSDVNFEQYNNIEELLAYCDNSANPVGEIILRLFDEANTENLHYSNCICSALQLINFWQDISIDLKRGRCYIPISILGNKYEYNSIEKFFIEKGNSEIDKILQNIYQLTTDKMNEGKKLLKNIRNFRLRLELNAIVFGGETIFNKIKKQEKNIFIKRPKLF